MEKEKVTRIPICNRCLRTKTRLQGEKEGEWRWWCFNCESPLWNPNLKLDK